MPLSHSQAHGVPGDISYSRKRSHAEITRSESHSQSPHPPSKRRRTNTSLPPPRTTSSPVSTPTSTERTRYPGDGFDYRRPVMSGASNSQQANIDTIDLTLDDDSPPPSSFPIEVPNLDPDDSSDDDGIEGIDTGQQPRAPPFNIQNPTHQQPVIDLSSDDEDETHGQIGNGTALEPDSPEIQFMGERALPQPVNRRNHPHRVPHLPTPPAAAGHFGSMANFLRDMTQNMFLNLRGAREFPEETLNRIDGLLNHPPMGRGGIDHPPEPFIDEYDGLQMDYGRTAFDIGNNLILIDNPNAHGAPNRTNESAYKEPLPAKDGFTRNYDEDDMLICGLCGDELATGQTEQKKQVWIVKQCGHAYCGDCAHSRHMTKQKNKDTKRGSAKKPSGFRICAIPGCNKTVDSKTKMFQIYL